MVTGLRSLGRFWQQSGLHGSLRPAEGQLCCKPRPATRFGQFWCVYRNSLRLAMSGLPISRLRFFVAFVLIAVSSCGSLLRWAVVVLGQNVFGLAGLFA